MEPSLNLFQGYDISRILPPYSHIKTLHTHTLRAGGVDWWYGEPQVQTCMELAGQMHRSILHMYITIDS